MNTTDKSFEFDYPRTYHLEFSPGVQSDDKIQTNYNIFQGKEVVITEKLDGENTTILREGFHARSLDSPMNYTRSWIKVLHSIIGHEIPEKWRFCGENVNYFHSINYDDLESFFYLFSIWDENNNRLHYDETVEWAKMLDLAMPRVFDRGIFDLKRIEALSKEIDTDKVEGFVVSLVEPIHYSQFRNATVKWVRANHIQPNGNGDDDHWLKSTYPNLIGKDKVLKPEIMSYYTKR
ncbi:MAG: RNA ligase family protein [Chryseobacterium sp.]|uniref:RNA ligase family protein n=1 Tax=Chryseobacterium sp. TaxID=1871047 RepID=UPI002FC8F494